MYFIADCVIECLCEFYINRPRGERRNAVLKGRYFNCITADEASAPFNSCNAAAPSEEIAVSGKVRVSKGDER